MDTDPRQTALFQHPTGKGLAPWMDGGQQRAENLDDAALRGTSPIGDTHITPAFQPHQPALSEILQSGMGHGALNTQFAPEPPRNGPRLVVGISGAALAGVLVCVFALHLMRSTPAHHQAQAQPQPISAKHEVTQAVSAKTIPTQGTPEPKSTPKQHVESAPLEAPATGGELPESTPDLRLKSRFDPEVMFELDLSLEQAAHVRTILERCSKDLPFAEVQIRGLLTEEQNRQWESIAP